MHRVCETRAGKALGASEELPGGGTCGCRSPEMDAALSPGFVGYVQAWNLKGQGLDFKNFK